MAHLRKFLLFLLLACWLAWWLPVTFVYVGFNFIADFFLLHLNVNEFIVATDLRGRLSKKFEIIFLFL